MVRAKHEEAPSGEIHDSSYVSKGQKVAPVVSDDTPVEEAYDDATADTDAQLGKQLCPSLLICMYVCTNH